MSMLLPSGYTTSFRSNGSDTTNQIDLEPGFDLNKAQEDSVGVQAEPGQEEQSQAAEARTIDQPIDLEARREKKHMEAQAEWARRRQAGYEDYGAEMGKDAKVWQIYVKETDRMDHEMVEGWNKSLDVLLIFAALFSAISTAFIIVTSEGLQEDPTDTSARALLAISQTLFAISNGQQNNSSGVTDREPPAPFTPSRSAILVNILLYLSLSLSVATSLVAMLAKEWCYSFMSNRSGQMYEQGRRRQERWNGILRWKMMDVLALLPMVMHLALFLFALGLCVYLWNICIPVALPVIATTSTATLIYVSTFALPLVFNFCPYATASSRLFQTYFSSCIRPIQAHMGSFVKRKLTEAPGPWWRSNLPGVSTIKYWVNRVQAAFIKKLVESHRSQAPLFADAKLLLANDEVPMDVVTSEMLGWLLANCEDPKLTTVTVQSLAGAEPWLPRLPLLQHGVLKNIYQHLERCFEFDIQRHAFRLRPLISADLGSLYLRALNYALGYHSNDGFYRVEKLVRPLGEYDPGDAYWSRKMTYPLENVWNLEFDVGVSKLAILIADSRNPPNFMAFSRAHDVIALGNIYPNAVAFRGHRAYPDNLTQIEIFNLLEQHINGEFALHPSTTITMVRRAADRLCAHGLQWYMLAPKDQLRLPLLLVRLFCLPSSQRHQKVAHTIAVALAASAFTFGDYPGWSAEHLSFGALRSRAADVVAHHYRSRVLFDDSFFERRSLEDSRARELESLLHFGLLGLLEHPLAHLLCDTDLDMIIQAMQVGTDPAYAFRWIHTLSQEFTYSHHLNRVSAQYLRTDYENCASSENQRFALVHAMHRARHFNYTPTSYVALLRALCHTGSVELQVRICDMLRLVHPPTFSEELVDLLRSNDIFNALNLTLTSSSKDHIMPTAMRQLWLLTEMIIRPRMWNAQYDLQQLLQPLLPNNTNDNSGTPTRILEVVLNQSLPLLQTICDSRPQLILQSGLLGTLLEYYRFYLPWNVRANRRDDALVEAVAESYRTDPTKYKIATAVEKLCKLAAECLATIERQSVLDVPQLHEAQAQVNAGT